MLIRIVKMTFREDACEAFLEMFHGVKQRIRAFEGCQHLELLRDTQHPHIMMTYSHWESEKALELYRNSELFQQTWKQTKTYFAAKPEAWSMYQEALVNEAP